MNSLSFSNDNSIAIRLNELFKTRKQHNLLALHPSYNLHSVALLLGKRIKKATLCFAFQQITPIFVFIPSLYRAKKQQIIWKRTTDDTP